MTRGETGLPTLLDSGLIPETPYLPEAQSWAHLFEMVHWLTDSGHKFRTLVMDTLNGAERLCHEYICDRNFEGD